MVVVAMVVASFGVVFFGIAFLMWMLFWFFDPDDD